MGGMGELRGKEWGSGVNWGGGKNEGVRKNGGEFRGLLGKWG